MGTRSLLVAGACLVGQLACAQSVPARSFMLGPSVGIDQLLYVNSAEYVGSPTYSSPSSLNVGIDASYQVNRLLIGTKVLYTNRLSRVKSPIHPPNPEDYVSATETDLHVLTVPLSMGYRLTHEGRFQWFIGGNVGVEYLLSNSRTRYYMGDDTVLGTVQLSKSDFGKSVNIGYGVQTTLRYQLTPLIGLQAEPALRYYPRGGFPTKLYNNYQFQSTFAILVNIG
ncbi:outer membrane beta-barrel protein [Fibrella arboris]|uniref:outer membrane beta-barrel protein n=1 Tax=Fibrella arboris TaxID=3242486 RepID=UPI00351FB110